MGGYHTVTQLHNLHAGNILSFDTAGTPFTMAVTLLGKKKDYGLCSLSMHQYAVSQCSGEILVKHCLKLQHILQQYGLAQIAVS